MVEQNAETLSIVHHIFDGDINKVDPVLSGMKDGGVIGIGQYTLKHVGETFSLSLNSRSIAEFKKIDGIWNISFSHEGESVYAPLEGFLKQSGVVTPRKQPRGGRRRKTMRSRFHKTKSRLSTRKRK